MTTLPTFTTLHRAEFPGDRYATVMVLIENAAGAPPHTHPGPEMTYILEGEFTLSVDGRADQALKPGDWRWTCLLITALDLYGLPDLLKQAWAVIVGQ